MKKFARLELLVGITEWLNLFMDAHVSAQDVALINFVLQIELV